jgi:hypothetical protein
MAAVCHRVPASHPCCVFVIGRLDLLRFPSHNSSHAQSEQAPIEHNPILSRSLI